MKFLMHFIFNVNSKNVNIKPNKCFNYNQLLKFLFY